MKKSVILFLTIAATSTYANSPAGPNTSISTIPMMIVLFVVMWFLLIRPEQKRQKEASSMRETLKKGDYVVTSSGVFGTIKNVSKEKATLTIAKGCDITILKSSIASVTESSKEAGEESA